MAYIIRGANSDTGEDMELRLEAASHEEAEAKAARMGLFVSSIVPVQPEQPIQQHAAPVQIINEPPPYYQPQQPPAPVVHVNTTPRRSNSLGIAGLIVALVGFLICWVPFVAVLSMPFSALALLLGICALLVSIWRAGYGIGYPIASISISALALFSASIMGLGAFKVTGDALVKTAEAIEEANAALAAPDTQLPVTITPASGAIPSATSDEPALEPVPDISFFPPEKTPEEIEEEERRRFEEERAALLEKERKRHATRRALYETERKTYHRSNGHSWETVNRLTEEDVREWEEVNPAPDS